MTRLLGEVAGLAGDHEAKKRFLMNGLCRLVAADCWIWVMIPKATPGDRVKAAGFLHGGFSEERFAAFLQAIEHPDMLQLNAPLLDEVQRRKSHVTRLRQQMDPEHTFLTLPVYPLWQKADIGPLMLSCHPVVDEGLSLIGIYRREKNGLFDERDSRIAHIILSEVAWLHTSGLPQIELTETKQLSPRARTTLNLLLEGISRKGIASHLGISEGTVSGYVKDIYRYYKIHSHGELIRRFQFGDGGDV